MSTELQTGPIQRTGKSTDHCRATPFPVTFFKSVKNQFNQISNDDILLHMKNIEISDGIQISLALSKGNSSVTYQLNSPKKNDDHIEVFKETAHLMLNLAEKSWNTWIK